MKKKLRLKILAGALGLVLMVSLASTSVVSILLKRQNLDSVHASLHKSLTIVRNALIERQGVLLSDVQQMINVNQLSENIKYISDFSKKDISVTLWAYQELAKILLNRAMTSDLNRILIYDTKGRLVAFGVQNRQEGNFIMGFHAQGKFHYSTLKAGEQKQQGSWEKGMLLNQVSIRKKLEGEIPVKESVHFHKHNNHISLFAIQPVVKEAEKPEKENKKSLSRQIGVVVAEKELKSDFINRMNQLTAKDIQLFAGAKLSMGDHSDYKELDTGAIPKRAGKDWQLSSQSFIFNKVNLSGNGYFQALLPFYNQQEYLGAVTVMQSDALVKTNNREMLLMLSLVSLSCLLLSVPLAFFFSGKIVRPIVTIVYRLKDIAEGEGDLSKRLEVSSRDEIGQVAEWFNTFIDKIHDLIKKIAENSHLLNESSSSLEDISVQMDKGAGQTSTKSSNVAAAGEEMSANMTSVAAAMEQASNNAGLVASSTEEMTKTIDEISQNTTKARDITSKAVLQADAASGQVEELGNSANEIGKVIETITDISEQVNLLALNATIEAARAGDTAGDARKGFAVVANEIKELARQTAVATNDIKSKIQLIQTSTSKTVEHIQSITAVVNDINEIVMAIASAVEEQSVTTRNIAENVNQVSRGIEEVNSNIAQNSQVAQDIAREIDDVNMTANDMSVNSRQVKERSSQLSRLAKDLDQMVDRFKI